MLKWVDPPGDFRRALIDRAEHRHRSKKLESAATKNRGHVKGGQNISVAEIRDLKGVLARENADIGAYISFAEPTVSMKREAAEAGFYTSSDGTKYPRLQLLTIQGLLEGAQRLQRPLHVRDITFKPAPRHRKTPGENLPLNLHGG